MQAVFRSKHEFIFETENLCQILFGHKWQSYVRKGLCFSALSAYPDFTAFGKFLDDFEREKFSVNPNKICLLSRVLLWLEKMAGSVTTERNYDEKTYY